MTCTIGSITCDELPAVTSTGQLHSAPTAGMKRTGVSLVVSSGQIPPLSSGSMA